MRTKIRELRKRHGMTLQTLAEKIGTTPQTVQRLETQNMTVSTDWLEKFAQIFEIHPADLLERESGPEIEFLGFVSTSGNITAGENAQLKNVQLTIPMQNPCAICLSEQQGYYLKNTILIAEKFSTEDPACNNEAQGKMCLVPQTEDIILIRHVIATPDETVLLSPLTPSEKSRTIASPRWIAPIKAAILFH